MTATRHSFGTKEDQALALAETVAEHLNDGIAARGQASLAVSGGMGLDFHAINEAMIAAADAALYRAKEAGRGCAVGQSAV